MITSFIERWKDSGDEKSDTQKFWLELLHDVLGVEKPTGIIEFEKSVLLQHKSFIDAYIPAARVLIEQKSSGVNLTKPALQSDGVTLTPFEQAKRYSDWLPDSQHPRWIITCNFHEFHIHDMERPKSEPQILKLNELSRKKHALAFIINPSRELTREEQISQQAGELVRKLKKVLQERYGQDSQQDLSVFCVRIVFLLFAEDVGLLDKSQFHDYLKAHQTAARLSLTELFRVLNQSPNERSHYIEDDLKKFPHVDGGLFSDEDIKIPNLDGEPLRIILEDMSEGFDWSEISPPIFGAIFEDTLRDEIREEQGMHYTTLENIHKVIDPLFMNQLRSEFNEIRGNVTKLNNFRKKLTTLKFLDPACGSGNFLTESYLSLCELEILVVKELGLLPFLTVSIEQFYGIELEPFAVAVAKTALWIANIQMTRKINPDAKLEKECLPLKKFEHNIVCENALTYDWHKLVNPGQVTYIMGNPPFRGARVMESKQKEELIQVFDGWENAGNLDYVCCWYKKAADFMLNTKIKAAFVSTNSVCQGESVGTLWKPLFASGVQINFAWRTFVWESDSKQKAHVHCVIVGFTRGYDVSPKLIFESDSSTQVSHINAYLVDAPDAFIERRQHPVCDVPEIGIGNKPIDGGFYLFTRDEMEGFISKEPEAAKYFHQWYGAEEFINGKPRWCLYLAECTPGELRRMPECMKRVKAVRDYRLNSKSPGTVKLAETPRKFHVTNLPKGNYIVIPQVSSERRKYIPMGYLDDSVMCSSQLKLMPGATLYHFGVLTSRVHMAWVNTVAGRLEMRYRYSSDIVYNNFSWSGPSDKQRAKIESCAQKILDVRGFYSDSSLVDLYDPLTMPADLLKAHKANDMAVCEAYGFARDITEEEIVRRLMALYETLTN